jgi:ribosomal protein S21
MSTDAVNSPPATRQPVLVNSYSEDRKEMNESHESSVLCFACVVFLFFGFAFSIGTFRYNTCGLYDYNYDNYNPYHVTHRRIHDSCLYGSHPHSHSNDDDDDDDDGIPAITVNCAEGNSTTISSAAKIGVFERRALADYEVGPMHGSNAHYKSCAEDRDRVELRTATREFTLLSRQEKWQWPRTFNAPSVTVDFGADAKTLDFYVDVPYFAHDARYLLSFERFKGLDEWRNGANSTGDPVFSVCDNTQLEDGDDFWAHAPNALFYHKEVYGITPPSLRASHDERSAWTIDAANCARLLYTLKASPVMLNQKCLSRETTSHTLVHIEQNGNTVVSVSGVLWLTLLWKEETENGMAYSSWPYSFTAYVDEYDSKLTTLDVPATSAIIRSAHVEQKIADLKFSRGVGNKISIGSAIPYEIDEFIDRAHWQTHTSLIGTWYISSEDAEMLNRSQSVLPNTTSRSTDSMRLAIEVKQKTPFDDLLRDYERRLAKNQKRAEMRASSLEETPITLSDVKEWLRQSALRKRAAYSVHSIENAMSGGLIFRSAGRYEAHVADFAPRTLDTWHCEIRADTAQIQCSQRIVLLLTLLSTASSLYADAFDLLLCQTSDCSDNVPHSIRINTFISAPRVQREEVQKISIETVRLPSDVVRQMYGLDEAHTNRVCFQTLATGAPQIMHFVRAHVLRAWLCLPDSSESHSTVSLPRSRPTTEKIVPQHHLRSLAEPFTGCTAQKHYTELLHGSVHLDEPIHDGYYEPTVHEPGLSGHASTITCFNSSLMFRDALHKTVYAERQFFQAEVSLVPKFLRREHATAVAASSNDIAEENAFSAFFRETLDSPERTIDSMQHPHALETLQANFDCLMAPTLRQTLRDLETNNIYQRFTQQEFVVAPYTVRERNLHNMSRDKSSYGLAIVHIIIFISIVFIIYADLFLNRKSKAKK